MTQADHQLDFEALQELAVAEQPWPLASWYALPLSPEQAYALAELATACQQQAIAANQSPLPAQRLAWIAGFWLKGAAQMQYASLLATATTTRDRALTELIHGQLLCSVKRQGAQLALARGFRLAADLLSSEEYFVLMKRHELLACLSMTEVNASPAGLQELLLEAQVIKRLQKGLAKPVKRTDSHFDTTG